MLDGRKIAFINDFGIDFEKEHRGKRAFEMHGGIVLMVLGDTELYGSHNVATKSRSEDNTRGAFMADILSLPIGLEVEREIEVSNYDRYKRIADTNHLINALDIGGDQLLIDEAKKYLDDYLKGVALEGVGHIASSCSELVRAIQTNRHIFIKIPEALIAPEKSNTRNLFLRKLVQFQLANIVRAFKLNEMRNGGLAYDEALEPLMGFVDVYNINVDMPSEMGAVFRDYDLTEEEYEAKLANIGKY